MKEIFQISVIPELDMLKLINPIIIGVCDKYKLDKEFGHKMVLATEEIYSYCLKNMENEKYKRSIVFRICEKQSKQILIIVKYFGSPGDVAGYFKPTRQSEKFRLNTFEAIGMHIAREIADVVDVNFLSDKETEFWLTFLYKSPC
jgi:hypothetical protein